jgi:PIN like domain
LIYVKKRRDKCVLFLDECFGKRGIYERLKEAGFEIERFKDHFKRADATPEQKVKDPRVIKLCHEKGWNLVTTDSNMQFTHVEEIKKTNILIFATAHNSADDMNDWVKSLIELKAQIERHHKKHERPCFFTFCQPPARFTSERTFPPESATRRKRPSEV